MDSTEDCFRYHVVFDETTEALVMVHGDRHDTHSEYSMPVGGTGIFTGRIVTDYRKAIRE
jgi:hypothetical protein